jgi:GT2 family glycosyltransferase
MARKKPNKDLNVSVIITNYNGKHLLQENLPLVIGAKKNSANKIKEIILVDDASTDESSNFVKNTFPEIRVITHKKNRGFSASTNTGARSSRYPLLALLNSDVKVSNDFLISNIALFDDERVFAVSMHEKGFGYAVGKFDNGFLHHRGAEEADEVKNTFWVNGGSGVFRRDYWMQLGGLDETLYSPFYWEDVDLGYRALKRGFKLLWDPNSKVNHEHESTMMKISRKHRELIQERNQLVFIWKNITSPNLIKKHYPALLGRIVKHPGYLIVFFMAFAKISKISKARKKENKECKVSDEAIFSAV